MAALRLSKVSLRVGIPTYLILLLDTPVLVWWLYPSSPVGAEELSSFVMFTREFQGHAMAPCDREKSQGVLDNVAPWVNVRGSGTLPLAVLLFLFSIVNLAQDFGAVLWHLVR